MKKLISASVLKMALASLIATSLAQAKVGDFNSLILENSQAQKELHQNLSKDLDLTRLALQKDKSNNNVIVDNNSQSINVPTSKSILSFQKEKKYYRPSEVESQKRLALELSEAE